MSFLTISKSPSGAAIYYSGAYTHATGATGADGVYLDVAQATNWDAVRFINAASTGTLPTGGYSPSDYGNTLFSSGAVIGGTTPIGDIRGEETGYVLANSSTIYGLESEVLYSGALYVVYSAGGTDQLTGKVGIGISNFAANGYYAGAFTTRDNHNFDTILTVDTGNLNSTGLGSGVYTIGEQVTLQTSLVDRIGNSLNTVSSITEDSFVKSLNISILDENRNLIQSGYKTDYTNPSFTFTKQENIDIFGSFTKNFGVRFTVENQDGETHDTDFLLYGNRLSIDKIFVSASGGTFLDENPNNNYGPATTDIAASADKTEALSGFSHRLINSSGTTGAINFNITFDQTPNFTNYDNLLIFAHTGTSVFDTTTNNLLGTFPLTQLKNQNIRVFPDDGIEEGEANFFKFVGSSKVGSYDELFTVGPYTLEPIQVGEDPILYNVGDQEIVSGNLSILGDDAGGLYALGASGSGDGNRLTGPGHLPYLLSGDSTAETQNLQQVTDVGHKTSNSIVSSGDFISGVTGLFNYLGIGTTVPFDPFAAVAVNDSEGNPMLEMDSKKRRTTYGAADSDPPPESKPYSFRIQAQQIGLPNSSGTKFIVASGDDGGVGIGTNIVPSGKTFEIVGIGETGASLVVGTGSGLSAIGIGTNIAPTGNTLEVVGLGTTSPSIVVGIGSTTTATVGIGTTEAPTGGNTFEVVGIGSTAPSLIVSSGSGTAGVGIGTSQISSTGNTFEVVGIGSNVPSISVKAGIGTTAGYVGIGSSDPGFPLDASTVEKANIAARNSFIYSTGSAIFGGANHIISGDFDVIAGGANAHISGGNFNFIGGGTGINVDHSTFSTSIGGRNNDIFSGDFSVIGGGLNNLISGIASDSHVDKVAIVGGENNKVISAPYAFIGAGNSNLISGTNSLYSTIIGGGFNKIKESQFASILGGDNNTIEFANHSVSAGNYSKVKSGHAGAFVFSDSRDSLYESTGGNTLNLRFESGVFVDTDSGIFINGNPVVTGTTAESDTLQTVTDRGATTTNAISVSSTITNRGLIVGNGTITTAKYLSDGSISGASAVIDGNISGGADFFGTGASNRITKDGVPYMLSGDSLASGSVGSLQNVTDNGATTTNAININNSSAIGLTTRGLAISNGMYSVAEFSTAGSISGAGDLIVDTDALFVDVSANRVGINEDSVDATLHMTNVGGGVVNQKFERAGASAWRLGIPNGQTYFAFDDTNDDLSTAKLVITKTDGYVGIGTNSPGTNAHLEIYKDNPQIVLTDSNEGTNDKTFRFININEALNITARTDGNTANTAGGDIITLLRDGQVGINDTSPANMLSVSGNTSSQIAVAKITRKQASASNNTYTFEVDSSAHTSNMTLGGAMAVDVNAGRAFTINGFGRVGIGTNNPSRDLQIGDGSSDSVVSIVGPTAGLSQLALGDTDDDNYGQILVDHSANKLQIQNGGGGAIGNRGITLDSSENVGIGTNDPSGKLHVEGSMIVSGDAGWAGVDNQNGAIFMSTAGRGLLGAFGTYARPLITANSDYIDLGSAGTNLIKGLRYYAGSASSSVGTHNFYTSGSNNRLHIAKGGNVGIGTDAPETKVHVQFTGTNGLRLRSTDDDCYMFLSNSTANRNNIIYFGDNSSNFAGMIQYNHQYDYMAFRVDGGERVRISAAGDVGIGTNSPSVKLQTLGTISGYTGLFSGRVGIGTNTPSGEFDVAADTDVSGIIGRANIGYMGQSDSASFSHIDYANAYNYAIKQNSAGNTLINTKTAGTIAFSMNNSTIAAFNNGGDFFVDTDTLFVDASTDKVGIGSNAPAYVLDAVFAGDDGARIRSTDNHASFYIQSAASYGAYIRFGDGANRYWIHNDPNDSLYFRPKGVAPSSNVGVVFDETGRVGIGTSNPDTRLHVKGTAIRFEEAGGSTRHFDIIPATAGVNHKFTSDSTSAGYEFYNNANSLLNLTNTEATFNTSGENIDFRVKSSGSTAIFVDASIGTVGINQSSPSSTYALDVGGSIRMATAAPSLVLRETDSSNQEFSVFGLGGDFYVRDITQSTYPFKIEAGVANDTLVLESGGNVGIGTNDPQKNLDVQGQFMVRPTSNTTIGRVLIASTSSDSHIEIKDASSTNKVFLHSDGDSYLNGGNVGIGTDSPSPTSAGRKALHVKDTSNGVEIRAEGNGSTVNMKALSEGFIGTQGADKFNLQTNNTNRVTIDTDGNVGIGITNPTAKLQVIGDISGSGSFLGTGVGNRITNDGTPYLLSGDVAGGGGSVGTLQTVTDNGATTTNAISIHNTSAGGNPRLSVGRETSQSIQIDVDDNTNTIVARQDTDSNQDHNFVLNRVFAGTGRNDFQINRAGVTQVTVDNTGNVGIGTTNPSSGFSSAAQRLVVGDGQGHQGITVFGSSSTSSNIYFADGAEGSATYQGFLNYRHDSSQLKFGAAGGTRMTLNGNGLLIFPNGGTPSTPNAELEISSSAATIRLTDSDLTNHYSEIEKAGVYTYLSSRANASDGGFIFFGGATDTEFMRIDTDGDVGIGSNVPSAKLDVAGGIKLLDNNYLTWNSSNTRIVGNSSYLQLQVAAVDKVRVTKSGVGIGTNTPTAQLTVSGHGIRVISTGINASDGEARIGVAGNNSRPNFELGPSNNSDEFQIINGGYWKLRTTNDVDLAFGTNSTNAIYIEGTNQNVGIGTDTPRTTLHVSKAGTTEGGIVTIDNPNNTDGSYCGIEFINSAVGYPRSAIFAQRTGGYDAELTFHTSDTNQITGSDYPDATERMRIDHDGNVGIGTNNPARKLDVSTNAADAYGIRNSYNASYYMEMAHNRFNAVGNNYIRFNIDDATKMTIVDSDFGGGVNGVGIGITNPTTELQVSGTISGLTGRFENAKISNFNASDYAAFGHENVADNAYAIRQHSNGNTHINAGSSRNIEFRQLNSTQGGFTAANDFFVGSSSTSNAIFVDVSEASVGIGTTAPSGNLHVENGASSQAFSTQADELLVDSSDHGGISILTPNAKRGHLYFNNNAFLRWVGDDDKLSINTSASSTTIAIAESAGNTTIGGDLLIGSPTDTHDRLMTQGAANLYAARFNGSSNGSQSYGVRIRAGTTSVDHGLLVENTAGADLFMIKGDGNVFISGGDVFGTGNGERLTTNGVPYLLSGDAAASLTLQDVTDNGNTTTNAIIIQNTGQDGFDFAPLTVSGAHNGTQAVFRGTGIHSFIQFQNSTTAYGSYSQNGLTIGNNGADAYITQREAANLYLMTSGEVAMTINSERRVGIGTLTPKTILDIDGAANHGIRIGTNNALIGEGGATGTQLLFWNGTSAYYGRSAVPFNHTVSNHFFRVGGGDQMAITSAGVGIGTASPTAKLTVDGESSSKGIELRRSSIFGTGNVSMRMVGASGSPAFGFNVSGVERMRIVNDGSVGIGTTDPLVPLHVQGTPLVGYAAGDVNADTIMTIENDDNARLAIVAGSKCDVLFGDALDQDVGRVRYDHSDNHMAFFTNASEKMRIKSGGNVGIGTSNPTTKLEVSGSVSNSLAAFRHGSDGVEFTTRTSNGRQQIDFLGTNTSAINAKGSLHINYDTNNDGANDSISFTRNAADEAGTLDMIIKEGDVGIGSASPSRKLDVNGDAQVTTNLIVGTALYTNQWIANSAATQYIKNNSAATSVAITNAGNVGIGTDSPSNALDVVGHFSATSKSFLIDHPTKENKKLQYASLEGPENGVYVRGTTNSALIELPDYWSKLVHEDSITVVLTPIGKKQDLYIKSKNPENVIVGGVQGSYDYVVYGERKDIDKLEIEPLKV